MRNSAEVMIERLHCLEMSLIWQTALGNCLQCRGHNGRQKSTLPMRIELGACLKLCLLLAADIHWLKRPLQRLLGEVVERNCKRVKHEKTKLSVVKKKKCHKMSHWEPFKNVPAAAFRAALLSKLNRSLQSILSKVKFSFVRGVYICIN